MAVLVVEDEALIRIDAAVTIEEAGFKVYEAGDADQAVRLLERADIRILFTDVEMPGSARWTVSRSPITLAPVRGR